LRRHGSNKADWIINRETMKIHTICGIRKTQNGIIGKIGCLIGGLFVYEHDFRRQVLTM
jgi:hypothetical protein